MPGLDGTGPFGTGPVGRGLGPCSGGYTGRFFRNWGRGFRQGGRFGWNSMVQLSPEEEINLLEQEKSCLERQIEALNKRLLNIRQSDETNMGK